MNILEITNNLYTNKSSDWIINIEESDIQPYVIQRWLCMNDHLRNHTRILDKYVFSLPPKMYLSLAWSIIPKSNNAPYIKYIKQVDESEDLQFIFDNIRKQFKLSDNDFNSVKGRLLKHILKNKSVWFKYYGVKKKEWKIHLLDYKSNMEV